MPKTASSLPPQASGYDLALLGRFFRQILGPESAFYHLAIAYSIMLGLLTLAVPVSVQTLISSVANVNQYYPIIILSVALLILLLFSGMLYALQGWVMERFERHLYARLCSEIVFRTLDAEQSYFESINRDELQNRYFEIHNIQKIIPHLLVGGFSLLLQMLVGFVVVSFYHPLFLLFNILLILCVWVLWRLFSHRAIQAAIKVSEAKYRMAHWLEELARANSLLRAGHSQDFAITRSNDLVGNYIQRRRAFFGYHFSQVIGLLVIYALASALLLGIGGSLVVKGQLTLGQLVAAELILSAILYGLSRFGTYLSLFYELCASVEKLSRFFTLPQDTSGGKLRLSDGPAHVLFDRVEVTYRQQRIPIELQLMGGGCYLAVASSYRLQKICLDLLKCYRRPEQGRVLLGGLDVADLESSHLRSEVMVLDQPGLIECRISDYLRLRNPHASQTAMRDLLRLFDLETIIDSFTERMDNLLQASGYPLSYSETLRLKLCMALLAAPRLLIVTELYDILPRRYRLRLVEAVRQRPHMTLLCFSSRQDQQCFDGYLLLTAEGSHYSANAVDFYHECQQREG